MRPVCRGASPRTVDFDPYDQAKPELVSRIGSFCSYCERRILANLAVEHIQPKNLVAYASLVGRWSNFLLACVNCNSTKGDKDVVLADVLLPDRDNTFHAFEYPADGSIAVSAAAVQLGLQAAAMKTLSLVGLERKISSVLDSNGKLVAIDRVAQRMEARAIAEEAKADLISEPGSQGLRRQITRTAAATGFFSIWMNVFSADQDMLKRFIDVLKEPEQVVALTLLRAHLFRARQTLMLCRMGGKSKRKNGVRLTYPASLVVKIA